jgi:hypothetical protein
MHEIPSTEMKIDGNVSEPILWLSVAIPYSKDDCERSNLDLSRATTNASLVTSSLERKKHPIRSFLRQYYIKKKCTFKSYSYNRYIRPSACC